MSNKLPVLINHSDVYTEDVLKCIKETIRKKSCLINQSYNGAKTFSRDEKTFLTCIEDEESAWKEKFDRRKKNLTQGFFADKTKPYQTVGVVYLEAGDLVINSITDDLKSKIIRKPRHYVDPWSRKQPRKPVQQPKKFLFKVSGNTRLDPDEATAGYSAIKARLSEINLMKKGVQAEQSLTGYLYHKRMQMKGATDKKDDLQMKTPYKDNWKIVRTIGKIMGAVKSRDQETIKKKLKGSPSRTVQEVRKIGMKKLDARISNDIPEMEDKEEIFKQWRKVNKRTYLLSKLQAINMIMCALYSMKGKQIRQNMPLPSKVMKDLMRSDVMLDNYGKPVSWKIQHSIGEDSSNHPETPGTPETVGDPLSKPCTANQLHRKRISSISFGPNNRKARLVQLASKLANKGPESSGPRIETWEELLCAGDKTKVTTPTRQLIPSSPASKYVSKLKRRDTSLMGQQVMPENLPPWFTIAQAEKIIQERRRMALQGNNNKRTAEDVLNDIRQDFAKLQRKLSKDISEDLQKNRSEESKMVQFKFQTISLGAIIHSSLEKMRSEAKARTKQRKDSTSKPLKWYVDLKTYVNKETRSKDQEINEILEKIARFKYEDESCVLFAKEKLCLLVMSMPGDLLLTIGMLDAILFVLDKIFAAGPELLDFWLIARKFSSIATILKCNRKNICK